jgi:sarcosine oxidase subunit alpha
MSGNGARQSHRRAAGGLIDRSRTVRFTFDGKAYTGHAGDTLASALIANGQHMVARSFKYHRPRGILAAGAEDPAGQVQIGDDPALIDPNTRVSEQEIYDGLVARSQNCWPSLATDIGILNDAFSRFLPAGFYNKTFMGWNRFRWPNWMTFEPVVRATAGIGKAPRKPDPDRYESINRHCDALVVGGGPAGLMAALGTGRSGARVILVEETAALGGTVLARDPEALRIAGQAPADWVAEIRAELDAMAEVTILTRTTAFGYYSHNFVGLWQRIGDHLADDKRNHYLPRQRVWRVRARQVVLATGSIERPLVFHQNDRPGIMLAGAVQTYIHRYGVLPGRLVAVATNNDTGWHAALDMARAGAEIAAIVDVRRDVAAELLTAAAHLGIAIHCGSTLTGTAGRARIKAIHVSPIGEDGSAGSTPTRIGCDLLAMAGGWAPNIALFSQSRGKLAYDETIAAFRPGQSWQNERSAGAANGSFALGDCLTEGARAGKEAAAAAGFSGGNAKAPKIEGGEAGQGAITVIPELPSGLPSHKVRAWIDLQDDVTTKDLRLAVQEGYHSVEHAKRYTTTGMGTDQGKVANMNAFAFLAAERGLTVPQIGSTTFRQPYKPVAFGALAGQHVGSHFMPRRTTPMHAWHRDHEAVFEPVGDWLRARAFPKTGESFDDAVQREAQAARRAIGVLDASTLGKIDVRGPDAREFLNRVYTNAWMKLAPGKCRYGLMLGEDGMVMDDGVTACLADDHFHMTTTTGGAARVFSVLEDYLQTEWPDLKVFLTTTTEQWAVAAICGPKSPDLIGELLDDFDPDPDKFEFMSWRDATMAGVPVRVFRISFTGEISYEINIPATYGQWMWEEIMAGGARYGITPYGTEAMHLLRAEKGFVIVGQETDGTVTPQDLRMDWIVKKSGDFIGKRSLIRSDTAREGRKQLVGLLTEDPATVLMEGAHVIATQEESAPPVPMLGHVTSSYFSPNLNRSIALAMVKDGGKHIGETLWISRKDGEPIPVRVTETDFLALAEKGEIGGPADTHEAGEASDD